jgi:hypothetical protein
MGCAAWASPSPWCPVDLSPRPGAASAPSDLKRLTAGQLRGFYVVSGAQACLKGAAERGTMTTGTLGDDEDLLTEQDALERVLAGEAVAAGPGSPRGAAVATEPLPGLPGRTGVLPGTAGEAVRDSGRRPGWPPWALPVAGLALGIGLVAAVVWPDGGTTPVSREAGPTAAPASSASSTTIPPAPSAPGVDAALANLSAVIAAARQQGPADQEVEDLLHQAGDLGKALQENPKDKDEDDGKGGDNGKDEDAAKKVAELERKVEELIGQGKIRPPATTQIQQAVAQLAQAVQAG